MERQLYKIAEILIGLVSKGSYSANKGIHSDPKSLAAFGPGDARRYAKTRENPMSLMSKIFPPEDMALEMEPEELAVPLLECLCQFEETKSTGMLNRYTFTLQSNLQEYGQNNYNEIAKVISEAWVWLEKEGLIAPDPGGTGDWIFITRRGRKFRQTADVRNYRAASLLPDKTLDPRLASKVRPPFLRGDYDTAVFEAFKEVEVRVRTLAPEHKTELGVNLMRKAFHPENGPLTDNTQGLGERHAISDLFAGAIGSFKNPSSHRDVDFTAQPRSLN